MGAVLSPSNKLVKQLHLRVTASDSSKHIETGESCATQPKTRDDYKGAILLDFTLVQYWVCSVESWSRRFRTCLAMNSKGSAGLRKSRMWGEEGHGFLRECMGLADSAA